MWAHLKPLCVMLCLSLEDYSISQFAFIYPKVSADLQSSAGFWSTLHHVGVKLQMGEMI